MRWPTRQGGDAVLTSGQVRAVSMPFSPPARAARMTDPMPVSSGSSAPATTTLEVFSPALGMRAIREEPQEGVGDLLQVMAWGK